MNITQLQFSDSELQKLVTSYVQILIYALHIDGNIDKKEVKILISLFARIDIDGDNRNLEKCNLSKMQSQLGKTIFKNQEDNFKYIQLFDLENLIFHEAEKSLPIILLESSKENTLSFDKKIERLKEFLENIQEIIEGKREKLGDDAVYVFYYGIYFYVKLIAQQHGTFFGGKILSEEEKYLDIIKKTFNITNEPKQ